MFGLNSRSVHNSCSNVAYATFENMEYAQKDEKIKAHP